MSRRLSFIMLAIVLLVFILTPAYSEVEEEREGDANPVVVMGKGALYGAGTGLLLGLATTLVVDEPTEDVLKWSFVGGTFGGFLIGAFYAFSRPSAAEEESALLEFDRRKLTRLSIPEPSLTLHRDKTFDVELKLVRINL